MSGADGGTSILETPPYVVALVFLFFLVITLGFEKVSLNDKVSKIKCISKDFCLT